jgi:hypothetical protein
VKLEDVGLSLQALAPDQAGAMEPPSPRRPAASVSSGNPRITVAFPFSTIRISQADPALLELAEVVRRLAEHTAVLARELDTDEAEALESLLADATTLVARLAEA